MSQNGQPVPNLAQILAALNASQPQPQPQSQQQQDADHSPSLPPDNPYQGQTSSFPTSSNDPQQYGYGYTGYDANPVPPQPSVPFPNHSYPSLSSGIPALPQQQWQPHPSISSLPSLHYPNTHNHVPSQPQPQRTTTPPERPPSTAARPASTSIEAVAKPQQDPATITTWSAAVRHVTRLAARREELGERVERMLRTAQEHEGQWWAGREALRQKQADRVEGQRKIEETLRAINAPVTNNNKTATEIDAENAEEMKTYDRKVHRAASTMVKEMRRELAALGVPFFEMKNEVIANDGSGGGEGKIAKQEVVSMQKKMLRHLEDLYGEDGT